MKDAALQEKLRNLGLTELIDWINKMEDLGELVENREIIDLINSRLDSIDGNISDIDDKINSLETDLAGIDANLAEINNRLDSLESDEK